MPFQEGESGELFSSFIGSVMHFAFAWSSGKDVEGVLVCFHISRSDNLSHPSWVDTYHPVLKSIDIGDDPDPGDLLQSFILFIV